LDADHPENGVLIPRLITTGRAGFLDEKAKKVGNGLEKAAP
jgi:hypothetical protein